MSDIRPILLLENGTLRSGSPPYWVHMPGIVPIAVLFLLTGILTFTSGATLFGWHTLRILAISVAVALLVESSFYVLTRRTRFWSESHAILIGVLFTCTLPPTVHWYVPVAGAALAVIMGLIVPGGVGNYIWHPVAIGRIAVQILFYNELTPSRSMVLAKGHLLWGNISKFRELPDLADWATYSAHLGIEAWSVVPPIESLRLPISGGMEISSYQALAEFVRDVLPPWPDTLAGICGGEIGTACTIVVVMASLLLLWRGLLCWPMVLMALLSATVLAGILPVRIDYNNGIMTNLWFPGLAVWQHLPVGLIYVCYHLTAGGFLFVILLLAPDPSSSPLTLRGHAFFGMLIGCTTIILRVMFGIPAAAYWALLMANSMVPLINRLTRRRVFGTR